MDKRQFLEAVTEQIRFEKAREMISDELENHIEDQKEAFMSEGISETESYQKAIEDMGDPVEVGISLDRIHRPKMEWKMILLVLGLSILGLFFQYVMFKDMGSESYPYNINSQCVYIMIGLAVMMFFCFFDYTRIGLWGKTGAAVLLLLLLYSYFGGLSVFGQRGYLRVGGLSVSLRQLIYLYIPFYGGILYSYKNQGRKGFTKSMVWSVLPVVLVLKLPDLSTAGSLMLIMLIQVCFITRKGWFGEWKKKLAFVVSAVIGLPVFLVLYFVFFGAEYQKARLFSVFNTLGDQSYQINMARNLISGSKWIGEGRLNAKGFLPAAASDYIVTYVMSYYGILTVIVLLAVLGLFIFKTFKISVHQKNQLGTVIGVGCSLVFMIQIVLYVMVNLTIFPSTAVFLPLFTYGGTGTIVSFALIGILLSIYRYQNVLPVHMVRKQKVKLGL